MTVISDGVIACKPSLVNKSAVTSFPLNVSKLHCAAAASSHFMCFNYLLLFGRDYIKWLPVAILTQQDGELFFMRLHASTWKQPPATMPGNTERQQFFKGLCGAVTSPCELCNIRTRSVHTWWHTKPHYVTRETFCLTSVSDDHHTRSIKNNLINARW